VSLHYYPHEDLQIKPGVRPEGLEPGAGDYVPIAIINLTLVMALVSFAINDGLIGSLVVLGLIGGFNMLMLRHGRADREPASGGGRVP
jgi:hypothetical protein